MATKVALSYTSVHMLLSIRFIAGSAAMIIVLLLSRTPIVLKGKPVGLFLLMGLCEPVIYYFAETYGIKYTTSSFSGLMISLIPVSTAILSALLIHEKLTIKKLAWIMCSVAGVLVISVNQSSSGAVTLKGILFLIGAMTAAAFYSILSRTISGQFSPMERTSIMMFMGCLAFTATALVREGAGYPNEFISAVSNPYVMIPVLFLSMICSVTAYYLLNYAMTYLEVNTVAVFTNIIPVVSVLSGVLILGEPFSLIFIPGIVLILGGVYMVSKTE